jgi:DNA-directed RNA polymerase subunit M/transcription elongation factor TFIIS
MGKLNTAGRCPKCGGSLYLEKDYNGWYEECLQCGHTKDLAVVYQSQKKTLKTMPEEDHGKVGSDTHKKNAAPGK